MSRTAVFEGRALPLLLLAPQLLILLVFLFWPAGQALIQAVFLVDAFGGNATFVGLQNFLELFAAREYRYALEVTAIFTVATTTLAVGLGLVLALAVDRLRRSATVFRTLLIWPYAVAPAVAGVLFMFLLNPTIGVLAFALNRGLGLGWDPTLDRVDGMILVVVASAWKQVSYNFVFFLTGMMAIPRSIIEAAALDGAGPVRRAWHIVMPLLSPTTFFLVVVNIVYAFFDTFGVVHTTTAGGPAGSTTILVYKVYRDGFVGLDLGLSSAQSVIIMVIVVVLTVLQFRYIERRVHYGT
ncbi:MAG: ABC transporter permease subunit [Alphaproteobacteria bacterium]|nr:ABC transporter permease subunit [Alphaproteobacteria bacterium]